jgi:hypothetical protein
LLAAYKAPRTVASDLVAVRLGAAFLTAQGMPGNLTDPTRELHE